MASKNTKNKAVQTKKVSEVSDSVVDEIMDMKVGGKKTEKAKTVEEPMTVVEEKGPVVTEEAVAEEKVAEPAVKEEAVSEEEPVAKEEEMKEETDCVTLDVTVVETEAALTPATEEPTPLAAPTADVDSQNHTVKNDPSILKDEEKKKEAPRPRRRTTREVYGYDVSGYNFDL